MKSMSKNSSLVLSCREDNDLLEVLRDHQIAYTRVDTPLDAVK